MIVTRAQRLELLEACGLDAVVVEPFDHKFAHLKAEEWFNKVLVKNLHSRELIVGYDFTFGSRRSGTVERLEILCKGAGIECHVLEAQLQGDTLISSTRIRAFVAKGDVESAAQLLGRRYFIDGKVIAGAGRGAELGIRTANLKTDNELLPLNGVYACYAEVEGRRYAAVTNLGMNPTFGGQALSL